MLPRRIFSVLIVATASILAAAAHATPLALTTGLSVSMASGTTALLTLSTTNLVGGTGDITTFNGFGLALQLIPQAGASGTVQFNNFFVPATNGILPDPGDPQFELDGITNMSPVNGSTVATAASLLMSEAASPQDATVPQGVLKNLGTLQFIATANAAGTWTLYAVNDGFGRSYWTDSFGNETDFDQLPAANGTSLVLGTVSIVPEPPAVALATGAVMMLVAIHRRTSRTRT